MNKKTIGLIAVIATTVLCGCPGLIGIIFSFSTFRDDVGTSLLVIGISIFQIAIPVGIYFLFFRLKQSQTEPSQAAKSDEGEKSASLIDELIRELKYRSVDVVMIESDIKEIERKNPALEMLGVIAGRSNVNDPLEDKRMMLRRAKEKEAEIRANAASKLGRSRDNTAVDSLITALGDEYVIVRISAIEALEAIGDKRAILHLSKLVQEDRDKSVQKKAQEVLERINLPTSQTETVEGTLPPRESVNISKVIVSFQITNPRFGLKGIEFLIDGNSKGLLQFTDIKEFEIRAGKHTAKMILHGVIKRASKELKFSLREGQILWIEGYYSPTLGNMNIELARDQSISGKLIAMQKKVNESICNVCGNKSLNGETAIVITAKLVDKKTETVGNKISTIYTYSDIHRIRVFICSDCKKDKKSFEKAVAKKDTEFGRIGEFNYWRDKDFDYSSFPAGDVAYFFIKDKLKDELDDRTQNKNVTLNFHSPKTWMVNNVQFQGGIWIDGILIALLSYIKGFDVSINVDAGKHTVSLGAAILNEKTGLTIYAEENKTYEFDCQTDRIMGGVKLIPRFPVN